MFQFLSLLTSKYSTYYLTYYLITFDRLEHQENDTFYTKVGLENHFVRMKKSFKSH